MMMTTTPGAVGALLAQLDGSPEVHDADAHEFCRACLQELPGLLRMALAEGRFSDALDSAEALVHVAAMLVDTTEELRSVLADRRADAPD